MALNCGLPSRDGTAHPRGAGLDDLELHVLLVPVAVGPAYRVSGLEIGGFDVPQGHLLVAEGEDAVPVTLDQLHEPPVGGHPLPFELSLPVFPKLLRTTLVAIAPQPPEGFLEQVRPQQLGAGGEDGVERLACQANSGGAQSITAFAPASFASTTCSISSQVGSA